MLGGGVHSEELSVYLWKVHPNESGSLDIFAFVRWYVDKEVSLEYAEEVEHLLGWICKVSLMDLQ